MAQSESDALRFSRLQPYGSARSTAMGGAFAALGGDLSSLSVNPGGIGVFRNSEVSFTSVLDFAKVTSGRYERERDTYLVGSLGFVASFSTGRGKWRSVNFAFNYTNLNNFNLESMLGGHLSDSTSMIDVWLLEANGHGKDELNPFTTGLAFDAYLIDLQPGSDNLYMMPLDDGDRVEQEQHLRERGYQGEYAISFGSNYNDKLYLGATLGIQSIHYRSRSAYREGIPTIDETYSKLDYYYFDQEFKTNGTGLNFKLGAIYRPIPELRLGLAIHTPTYYWLDAYAYNNISAYYFEDPNPNDDFGSAYGNDVYTNFTYRLRTPWRLVAGVATVLGQRAILSLDYEYVDYASAKFSNDGDGNDYDGYLVDENTYALGTNDLIKEAYRGTHNVRLGAEYRLSSTFSLRAGYAYWASPYRGVDLNADHALQTISGGLGLNLGTFYADFAYQHKRERRDSYFYYYQETADLPPVASPVVRARDDRNEFRLTLGLRF